ncbi:Putative zinc binding domain-containing protein [Nakamurella panacisegetis]|uniref:Putative zinc binding domain-containing protein n=1 Tax=Nakamurella panacisegetis TaxID=1090615 RepID=A0A1H0LZ52_9ACTN|nr:class I SAM-dependent methyltransferase [Nakamurella panacisegetis]SDO73478.1 Putative zinc binding domain-containing protein [Nakamurella panacisegetis]
MPVGRCRACTAVDPVVVLDLGTQPAADHFPLMTDPGPDAAFPLAMRLCRSCGLAQLDDDLSEADEPRAVEPEALRLQAAQAVGLVERAGLLTAARTVAEFGSPHGGSVVPLFTARGLTEVPGGPADVVFDSFGMMHEADQADAVGRRAARLAIEGTLLLQFHSLEAILRQGQWNALRHGHYAYYSLTSVVPLLAAVGLRVVTAWEFDLYGGTVLLAARRDGRPDAAVQRILEREAAAGVTDPAVSARLQQAVDLDASALHAHLSDQKRSGRTVFGYGAASRAVALLAVAGVDAELLAGVADASRAKQGRRMPGSGVPVISPEQLVAADPDEVLLLLPDLLPEVERNYPALAGRWRVHRVPEHSADDGLGT